MNIPQRPGSQPVASRPYLVAPHLKAVRHGFYSSLILFALKKDGTLRLCIDYRGLNQQTERDPFLTLVVADFIASTRGARMFAKLDLQAGFHQPRLQDCDQEKTAFSTPFGLFEWVTCPFGLANTPGSFQRLMTDVLREHIVAGYCCVYTDNTLIFTESDDPAEHMLKLETVLETLRKNELLVKGAKSELFRREVEFLGIKISAKGWAPTESKIATMVEWPAPETVKNLRFFLGMANFFRPFIPLFSEMAAPLTDLLKNSTSKRALTWLVECQESFVHIKQSLTSALVLCHFNPALRTAVHINASQNAVGTVLLQWQGGEDSRQPVAFMSRKLSGAQYRYDARKVEALAAQMALQTWRTDLLGVRFEIYSDHDSLKYLVTQKELSQRILRL